MGHSVSWQFAAFSSRLAAAGLCSPAPRDQRGTYAEAMASHGDIARFRVGPTRVGFEFDTVFSPEGAHQVLAADAGHYLKDAPVIREFRHFLGDGLLVSRGERWLGHRRIAQPLFTRRAVSSLWRPLPPPPMISSHGVRLAQAPARRSTPATRTPAKP
jgi:hypothetical protein